MNFAVYINILADSFRTERISRQDGNRSSTAVTDHYQNIFYPTTRRKSRRIQTLNSNTSWINQVFKNNKTLEEMIWKMYIEYKLIRKV